MLHQRPSTIFGFGLSVAGALLALAACTSSNNGGSSSGTPGTTGGSTTSTAGSSGSTGTTATTTGSTSATTGPAVDGSTGSTGGGTAGSDGGACASGPITLQCTGTAPTSATISDFTADASGNTQVFGGYGAPIFGGTYVYPFAGDACSNVPMEDRLTEDKSGGNWHITGQVATYSGFGFWWNCLMGDGGTNYANTCAIDASAYTGIQFTVSGSMVGPSAGDAGAPGIAVSISTEANTAGMMDGGAPTNCGQCTAATCGAPQVTVPVSETPTTVKLTWDQLGITAADASAITNIQFNLTNPPDIAFMNNPPLSPTPYPLDITIDDVAFTTD